MGHRGDRGRIVGPECRDRGRQCLFRKGSSGRPVARSAQCAGKAQHRFERISVRWTEDSAAPVHPFGQNLAGARILFDIDKHGAEDGHGPQRRGVLGPEHPALRVQQRLQGGSSRGVVAESALCQAQIVERAERRRVFGPERRTSPGNHALVQWPRSLGLAEV